eukprot:CAMPEP_0169100722 /NCGR_PEP_ID=MMETSP1015-20121227/21244_1 /TAXON_ID=342587 /ORGANISM="Karlodinium micrum, Strain CCMP2283" /LENGTH=155 /DNA_ID=CAMNT_0009161693 /DNA_START=278 /DNA_END=743 /DNA_ORIENTATION=-
MDMVMTPERQRLQDMVKEFAKLAVRGVSCQVIDGQHGQLYSAAYYVDAQLSRFSVLPSTPDDQAHELQMKLIQDFHEHEAGSAVAAEAVIWAGKHGKKDQLIVIELVDKSPPVFLLEASAADRDRFILCMKVLRLYEEAMQMQLLTCDSVGGNNY